MGKIDVLYIHPLGLKPNFEVDFLEKDEKTFFPFIPMGVIGIINSLIKAGYKVRGVNLGLKNIILKEHFSLEGYLKSIDFKVVLVDMHWYLHIKDGLRVANLCKKIRSECKVIVGGMSASVFSEELGKFPFIDYILKLFCDRQG